MPLHTFFLEPHSLLVWLGLLISLLTTGGLILIKMNFNINCNLIIEEKKFTIIDIIMNNLTNTKNQLDSREALKGHGRDRGLLKALKQEGNAAKTRNLQSKSSQRKALEEHGKNRDPQRALKGTGSAAPKSSSRGKGIHN